jgi:hypothetical protein
MSQHGPLISYDASSVPITMTVSTAIVKHVEQVFRENYRLPIDHVAQSGDQVTFTFNESVDVGTFLRHLETGAPEEYGSV